MRTPSSSTSRTTGPGGVRNGRGEPASGCGVTGPRRWWCAPSISPPWSRIVLRLTGGPMGDVVDARIGWHGERVRLGPGETREVLLPAGRGVLYYDTFLHVVHLRSQRAARLADGRSVGAFVEPRLVMGSARRPVRQAAESGASPARGRSPGSSLLVALAVDLPRVSDGRFWSDGATYHAAAGSLAFDGDVVFEARDLERVRAVYPGGPQGVFLKRVADGEGGRRLVYAKAAALPAGGRTARAGVRSGPRSPAAERRSLRRVRSGWAS